jgi:tRNA U34 5-methylaminomethyl-2-thiouridine-forming methyltransferase MnmC
MERNIVVTADGSNSLYVPGLDEHFHSVHGAVQESSHVFIDAGLKNVGLQDITIFEIGFGTGLNALLTYVYAENFGKIINYHAIEKYPLLNFEYSKLNYSNFTGLKGNDVLMKMHGSNFNKQVKLSENFTFKKYNADIVDFKLDELPSINLIYFDAFAPDKQAELWTKEIFWKLYDHAQNDALFVTYCAKGSVRRSLEEVGFTVERIPGPPGKREMLRAHKKIIS